MNKCAACGQTCLGHEIDSTDQMILIAHASEDHSSCHPDGCNSVGRSFHAHVCTNCGGDAACVGTRTANVCDTFDGFCKTCFVDLSRSEYIVKSAEIDATALNEHRRMRNTAEPPVTEAEVNAAETGGSTLKRVRKNFGPHRPTEKDGAQRVSKLASNDCEMCGQPSFVCNCDDSYDSSMKVASNECGTCGHNWAAHGDESSCSCCNSYKKSSIDKLPEWLKEAKLQIQADEGRVIDFDAYRQEKAIKDFEKKQVKETLNPTLLEGYFEGEDPIGENDAVFTEWPQPRRMKDRLRDAWHRAEYSILGLEPFESSIVEGHDIGIAHVHFDDLDKEVSEQAETPMPEAPSSESTIEDPRPVLEDLKRQVEDIQQRAKAMEEMAKQNSNFDDLIQNFLVAPMQIRRIEQEALRRLLEESSEEETTPEEPKTEQPNTEENPEK